jgi:KDO2-lipid IV(A) lauroyltransferase
MTQACADVLTQAVREHTDDWHMMQRVFTKDLVGARVSEPAVDGSSGDTT